MFFVLRSKTDGFFFVNDIKTSQKLNEAKLFSIKIAPNYDLQGDSAGGVSVSCEDKLPMGLYSPSWELIPVDLKLV